MDDQLTTILHRLSNITRNSGDVTNLFTVPALRLTDTIEKLGCIKPSKIMGFHNFVAVDVVDGIVWFTVSPYSTASFPLVCETPNDGRTSFHRFAVKAIESMVACADDASVPVSVGLDTNQRLVVSLPKSTSRFNTVGDDYVPHRLTAPEGEPLLAVPGETFAAAVKTVSFAAANEDVNPILASVVLYAESGQAYMLAADGFRAAKTFVVTQKDVDFDQLVIPMQFADEVAKFAWNENNIQLYVTDGHLWAVGDSGAIYRSGGKLMDTPYPDISFVFGQGRPMVYIQKAAMSAAMSSARAISAQTVTFNLDGHTCAVDMTHEFDDANAHAAIPVRPHHKTDLNETVSFTLSTRFATQATGAFDGGILLSTGGDGLLPVSMSDSITTCVIMPIKNEND